jgi:uncharacterized protein
MLIEDTFSVPLPIEDAWKILLDVERIAPCMPGAELQEIEGNEFRGIVKVKVGPITAQYKGAAVIETADEAARRIVLKASGRDTRGQGNASASVTADLVSLGASGTEVKIATDLTVTGKVAQFGRGVMQEVSGKLLGQFVQCLERDILSGPGAVGAAREVQASAPGTPDSMEPPAERPVTGTGGVSVGDPGGATTATATGAPAQTIPEPVTGASPNGGATTTGVRKIDSRPAEPVDLMAVSGGSIAKRLAPLLAGALALFVLLRRRRK